MPSNFSATRGHHRSRTDENGIFPASHQELTHVRGLMRTAANADVAGDAVVIAPVSRRIPWYQGILQGIFRFWGLETRFGPKKPLCRSHFSSNSLRKLTGKIFRRRGNFRPVTGNFTCKNRKRPFLAHLSPPAAVAMCSHRKICR
jgi:hypothetical protein